MNALLFINWDINPSIVDFGIISIKWWGMYFIFFPSFLGVTYLMEKSDWYTQQEKSSKKNKGKIKQKETKVKKFHPYTTYTILIILLLSRYYYCKKILYDASAFFQPLDKECFTLPLQLHWYSFFWILGLGFAIVIMALLYKAHTIPNEKFEPLFIYCFFGIFLGARLGHCLFYEPEYFFSSDSHFIEIFFPIKFDNSSHKVGCTGYQGLASHGGTIGLFLALLLYVRKYKINVLRVLDNIAIATPITACCIRLGNLMNSEIIGSPTDKPWGFIFHTNDGLVNGQLAPRHPAQLYEAIAYLIIFIIGFILYRKMRNRVGTGFFFGFCLASIFTFRFFIEFLKEVQVDFEQGMALDMGQLLSIPFIIVGIYCMIGSKWLRKIGEQKNPAQY